MKEIKNREKTGNINNKTYLTLLIIVLAFLTIVNFSSCDDGPINPNKKPSLKDYRWEVDTINFPGSFQTSMMTIWGNSINDLFIAGHNNRGIGKAFHFDGKSWEDFLPIIPEPFDTYSFYNSLDLGDELFLCGSAHYISNDSIIQITDSSLILSKIGDYWNISHLGKGGSIYSISGTKNAKLYAAGWDMTLFSYKDNVWYKKKLNIDIPNFYETKSITNILVDQNQSAYMSIFCYGTNPFVEKRYFAIESNDIWKVVDSLSLTDNYTVFGNKLIEGTNGAIYSYNPGIYVYNQSHWNAVWNKEEIITAMKFDSSNNIIAAGKGVYLYNGTSWDEYNEFYNNYGLAQDILILENKIIIVFSNSKSTYVVRGSK